MMTSLVVFMGACTDSEGPTIGERSGQAVYETYCFACHNTGAVGAPRINDLEALASLEARGAEALLKTTKTGIRAMPAKGTCLDCTDEELLRAIEYLLTHYRSSQSSGQ